MPEDLVAFKNSDKGKKYEVITTQKTDKVTLATVIERLQSYKSSYVRLKTEPRAKKYLR